MKAELIDEKVFTIKAGGVDLSGMRKVSTWNGLTELRDVQGNILIVANQLGEQESHFDTLFNNIFRTAKETRAEGVIIVMGSPALLMKLRPAQKPEDEAILN